MSWVISAQLILNNYYYYKNHSVHLNAKKLGLYYTWSSIIDWSSLSMSSKNVLRDEFGVSVVNKNDWCISNIFFLILIKGFSSWAFFSEEYPAAFKNPTMEEKL